MTIGTIEVGIVPRRGPIQWNIPFVCVIGAAVFQEESTLADADVATVGVHLYGDQRVAGLAGPRVHHGANVDFVVGKTTEGVVEFLGGRCTEGTEIAILFC